MNGWMDGCIYGWMDGWMDGCIYGWMNEWMDGWIYVRCKKARLQTDRADTREKMPDFSDPLVLSSAWFHSVVTLCQNWLKILKWKQSQTELIMLLFVSEYFFFLFFSLIKVLITV